nr:MAG TPA: hypothetical protein [Caudoviricetes sp.]
MAKFSAELPNDLIQQFKELADGGAEKMMKEMVGAGADVVEKNIRSNMRRAFKDTAGLEKCLVKTKTYKTPSDDGVGDKVAFYGYYVNEQGKTVPAPLVAQAREYGTSRGEKKKPFIRTAFKKGEITEAMLKVQEQYLKDE